MHTDKENIPPLNSSAKTDKTSLAAEGINDFRAFQPRPSNIPQPTTFRSEPEGFDFAKIIRLFNSDS
jgi:hypothetical protein